MQKEFDLANAERTKLQGEIAAMKREAEASWAAERVENALLRERINDVAAEVAKLAVTLEGPNSPIEAILASEAHDCTAARKVANGGTSRAATADTDDDSKGGLADRMRALQTAPRACRRRPEISTASNRTGPRWPGRLRSFSAFLASATARCCISPPCPLSAGKEDPEIAKRRATERKTFTDAEIIDGFFRIVFGAEFHVAGGVDRIRKYEMPIRVYADNRAKPDRRSAARRSGRRYPLQGTASRHRDGRQAQGRQCGGDAGARPRYREDHPAILRARAGRARS